MSSAAIFGVEALLMFAVVVGVHALRRRTSIVYSYAVIGFMRLASWAATHASMVVLGPLKLNVGSDIFFSAVLLGVFLLYVADGRHAGRVALVVVLGTGLLYAGGSLLLHAQFPDHTGTMFPDSGLRANLGSIAASVLDLIVLGTIWEAGQRGFAKAPLLLKVFVTLAAVMLTDALIYLPIAWGSAAGFSAELAGNLISRVLVAAVCAPVLALYLAYEVRRFGLQMSAGPLLSILLKEDVERELLSARHQMRLGSEALWESEERYRRMVDDIPVMVFRFSSQGLVTYANRALCVYYARDAKEILGIPVLTPIAEVDRPALWQKVLDLDANHPTVELTTHATPRQGAYGGQRRLQRWVVRGIFSSRGEGLAYQAIGEDITRESELEERLAQAQRMEAVGNLAGGVAHDLNNLVSILWACAESANRSLSKLPPEAARAVRQDLVDIRQGTDRAALLTRQLMAVGRRQEVAPRPVDVSAVVSALEALMRRLLPDNLTLSVHCAAGLPPVMIDAVQLERVIINLVTNARDAVPANGSIVVTTERATLDAAYVARQPDARAGEHIVLRVTDDGTGMDPQTAARVFEPFFTTKAAGRGNGLGLSTAYGIVKQAGGHMRVESTPGAGTTFFVYLPVIAGLVPVVEPGRPRGGSIDGPVLYCEGEDVMRTQVVQLLENAGHQVVCASSAVEVERVVAAPGGPRPRLLLTDVVSPGLPGLELARAVRLHSPDLPVILLTGSAGKPGSADAVPGVLYVDKRQGPNALLAAVAGVLTSRAPDRSPTI